MAGFDFRNKLIFEVFMKMYVHNKKYFICTLNEHVERRGVWTKKYKYYGYWLYLKFGADYLIINNLFDSDEYYDFDSDKKNLKLLFFDEPII